MATGDRKRSRRSGVVLSVALMLASGLAASAAARSMPHSPVVLAPRAVVLPVSNEPIAATAGLHTGLWEIRMADGGSEAVQKLCLGDAALLMQLRHQTHGGCSRFVVSNGSDSATVQYSCPGAGWGRTTLRASGAETVRIESQGIADNAPFAFTAVGRRTGDCAATVASAAH